MPLPLNPHSHFHSRFSRVILASLGTPYNAWRTPPYGWRCNTLFLIVVNFVCVKRLVLYVFTNNLSVHVGFSIFSLSGQRPISYCRGVASCVVGVGVVGVVGVVQSISAQKPRDKFSLNFVTSSATPLRRCVPSLVCVNLLVWTLQDFKVPML